MNEREMEEGTAMNEMSDRPAMNKSRAAKVKVSVTVADDYLDQFDDVVARARKAGMTTSNLLKALGVITGAINRNKIAALRSVEGVSHVELAQQYQLPPPDSPIQ